ncbi:AMP-binding protein [Shimia biformata]|uniref:AMP-binding protein n=1 Tax=Shimia biformata TaxID=1294299 RepID=UPI001950C567|nr:AMP-binding protein [Shimia biformata]
MPVAARFHQTLRQRPDALAVAISGHSFSYRDLASHIGGLDGWLRTLPASLRPNIALPEPGRLMALAIGNHPASVPILSTALTTPHAVAVMDPSWPDATLSEMLERCRPDVLFHLGTHPGLVMAADRLGLPAINLSSGLSALPHATAAAPEVTDPEGVFLLGFTSGTTSAPKCFARTRRSWQISLTEGRAAFGLTKASHTVAPGPLSHGLTLYAFAEALDAGACFFGLNKFSATRTATLLRDGLATRLVAVPSMIEALVARNRPFPGITNVTTAGAKLSPETLSRALAAFPDAEITEYYGASELGFVSLARHSQTGSNAPPHSVGFPFPHVDLSIRADGQRVAQGETGTVFVRGDLAIAGYLGPAQDGFRRDGDWATVGDMGRIDPDGSLVLLGREGGMILSGGYNIFPQEVAQVLMQAEGVTGAEVFGLPDPFLGQKVVAVLAGRIDAPTLAAHCRAHLPAYKLPRQVFTLDHWPMTTSGKRARGKIEEWLKEGDAQLVPLERFR